MQSDWCVLSNAEGYSNQALRMEAGFEPLGIEHHALFILHPCSPLQPVPIFPMSTMSVSPRTRIDPCSRSRWPNPMPRPTQIGAKKVWLISEIRAWVAAGAPDRSTWEALKAAGQ